MRSCAWSSQDTGDYDDEDATRVIMQALFEETKKDAPRFVEFWFRGDDGTRISSKAHAPIAACESGLVRAMVCTPIGADNQNHTGRTELYVGDVCKDKETLDAIVEWMYGLDEKNDSEAMSIGTTTKLMRVASYLEMPGLLRSCYRDIVSFTTVESDRTFDVSDENALKLTELWRVLSTTTLEGPAIDGPASAVRVALTRMLMQRSMDDPVVVDLLRGCSLEDLALLPTGVSCAARTIDLALLWGHQAKQNHPASDAVLAHIPLEDLPVCYISSLLASGRLALAGDKRRAHLCVDARQKEQDSEPVGPPAKKAKKAKEAKEAKEAKMPTPGWVGVLNHRLLAVDSEVSSAGDHPLLGVRLIGWTGIRCEVDCGTTAALVDGSVILFCAQQGMVETGYVYSVRSGLWKPFGIVPRAMVGVQYGSAVYGTWIVFVKMTGAGPSCVAFDVAKCTWLAMPDFTARESPCIAVVDRFLYVIGGAAELEGQPGPVSTERIRLDQCLDGDRVDRAQWERVQMPLARHKCSAVVIGALIYVTGGFYREQGRPAGTWSVSSSLTRIDTVAGTVENIGGPMHNGRCGHSSFVSSDGQIVVLGGGVHQYRVPNVPAESFSFSTMRWSPLTPRG